MGEEWETGTMTMMIKTVIVFVLLSTIIPTCASAQQATANQVVSDKDIQLLRQDLRSVKKQVVAANMLLTDAEAQKLWPVYDAYTAEGMKINDLKMSIINDYAANFEKLTDEQALALIKRWGDSDQSALQLRMKYLPQFQKVVSGKKVARFFQIDRRIGVLLDIQLGSEIPLVGPN
jgi:hypothetical protein